MQQRLLLSLAIPVVVFAAVLYCAIVVYWKVYSVRLGED